MDFENYHPMILVDRLCMSFNGKRIFNNVSFEANEHAILNISGPSGCGKTTLFRCIAGFEQPDSGNIFIGNHLVSSPAIEVAPQKRQIGMMFQDLALWPHMSVWENVNFSASKAFKNKAKRMEWVDYLLLMFRIDHMKKIKPGTLSGGEQQRVALARALANKPRLVLLDEPFSHLDSELTSTLIASLEEIISDAKITALVTLHRQSDLFTMPLQKLEFSCL